MDFNEWNKGIIEEFRANGGKVKQFGDAPMLILHTKGAKTGRQHVTPLVYMPDGLRMIIFASKAGAPENPHWFNNLMANPEVTVETGSETIKARATQVQGEERDRIFNEQARRMPNFAEYAAKTTRVIPVVALERV
ncbi:MAG: nitroreductase/quinone reductase family protein [Candidatus Xenobia bacterium]